MGYNHLVRVSYVIYVWELSFRIYAEFWVHLCLCFGRWLSFGIRKLLVESDFNIAVPLVGGVGGTI